jgi:flagellar basal-body rod modification protein FlgD
MTTITSSTGSMLSVSGNSAPRDSSKTLGYDAFLQLLIAQMQNQDPTEPMKSSDYVAQLATFSQVEKSVEIKDQLSAVLSATRLQQAEGLLGKTIEGDGVTASKVVAARISGNDIIAELADGHEITVTSDMKVRI